MRPRQARPKKFGLEQLRRLISEEARRALTEAKEKEEKETEDSLDSQVDSFFASYESEAKNVKKEGRDFRSFVRRFLMEAEEDEEKDEEGGEEKEPEKLTADDINIESFSDNVVRLIDNYDSLLEIRNTILRRAANFLIKSYEKDVVDAFKDDVAERHGLEIGKSKSEMEDEDIVVPSAAGAGASPGA